MRQSNDVIRPIYIASKIGYVPIFNESDVRKSLQSINLSQCLEPNEITSLLFKKCADVVCYLFTSIFIRFFSTYVISKLWRKMKIILIPKKVSRDKNVRFKPISLTSPFFKATEKLLPLILQLALKKHMDPYQFVYKCKINILNTAVVLHHIIMFSLEKSKKCVRYAFLDYTFPFDPILHNELISVSTESWETIWLHSQLSGRELNTVSAKLIGSMIRAVLIIKWTIILRIF